VILVSGASGLFGGRVAARLLERGIPVRAMSRDIRRLEALGKQGAEVIAADLRDPDSLARACARVSRVFTSANGILGKGRNGPRAVDRLGNRNLIDAARQAGVKQFAFTSALNVREATSVEFFRYKVETEEYLRASGLPWVILQPAAFLDVWIPMLTTSMRKNGSATLFGPGTNVANWVAVQDVAEIAARVLTRDDVVNEVIAIGGPDNLTMEELLQLAESALGMRAKRRHIPVWALRHVPPLLRPLNEVAARLMRLGHWSATTPQRFERWRETADRFGVRPIGAQEFLRQFPRDGA
jgi:uncharacterized protein YbjT (DUF2867 family)